LFCAGGATLGFGLKIYLIAFVAGSAWRGCGRLEFMAAKAGKDCALSQPATGHTATCMRYDCI